MIERGGRHGRQSRWWRHVLRVILPGGAWLLTANGADAQALPGGRTAIEAVAAVASSSDVPDDLFVWLDVAATVRASDSIEIVVRPYARRLPGGDWNFVLYQAQVKYQPAAGLRVDAGIIPSPIGLATLELRPDLNPVVSYPFYYFAPLPRFDRSTNELQVLAGGYPVGAVVSWSGAKWDARAAVTDSTPARSREIFAGGPSAAPQLVAGGGYSPIAGLRVGAAIATGRYRTADDPSYYDQTDAAASRDDAAARLFNLEAEYAFRYTRLSGEWVHDRFDSELGPAVARGFYAQAVHTLTPRLFAAGRYTRASTPVVHTSAGETARARQARATSEIVAGYRLTHTLTIKAGYQASHAYGVRNWNHTAVWSLVWTGRWF